MSTLTEIKPVWDQGLKWQLRPLLSQVDSDDLDGVNAELPGGVDAEEGHSLEAGLLRKVTDKLQQSMSGAKLVQVDTVSDSFTIGHYSHLETQTNTHMHTFFL